MNQPQMRAYEIRAGEKPLIVEGTAIVFNEPAQVNGYTERIAAGQQHLLFTEKLVKISMR